MLAMYSLAMYSSCTIACKRLARNSLALHRWRLHITHSLFPTSEVGGRGVVETGALSGMLLGALSGMLLVVPQRGTTPLAHGA